MNGALRDELRKVRGARNVALVFKRPTVAIRSVGPYLRGLREYRRLGGSAPLAIISPQFGEDTGTQMTDPHYFHQAGWAARHIGERRPRTHYDIGGQAIFLAVLTGIADVVGVELRPLTNRMPHMLNVAGDLLALPFADRTVSSLTCLHTIEHVGLGRYGDRLDPSGTEKAAAELARVLAPDGALYVTLPIGRVTRTEFNGHRVHSVDHVLAMFDSLAVFDFAVVDDAGEFLPHQNPSDEWDLHYGLGLFAFGR